MVMVICVPLRWQVNLPFNRMKQLSRAAPKLLPATETPLPVTLPLDMCTCPCNGSTEAQDSPLLLIA